jgi:pimeloyl-ACP methyl ester carboxylesterase
MPVIAANGVQLHYEETGDPAGPPILLVMGLGTQMIAWPDAFVAALGQAGYRVIRYDNRDIGLSTHLHDAPVTNPLLAFAARRIGLPFRHGYALKDMAADAVALLDALGIPAAHIVGASMGGMIAQILAASWPERVLSLTAIMSSSGAPGLPGPTPELRRRMIARRDPNPSREQAIAAGAAMLALISFPDPARAPDAFATMAGRAFDRAYNPQGGRRHLLAVIADGSRAARLATIRARTLVIHGAADPLVPLANGEDIARRVPGARLEVIEAMGHDLPPSQLGRIAGLILEHVRG